MQLSFADEVETTWSLQWISVIYVDKLKQSSVAQKLSDLTQN